MEQTQHKNIPRPLEEDGGSVNAARVRSILDTVTLQLTERAHLGLAGAELWEMGFEYHRAPIDHLARDNSGRIWIHSHLFSKTEGSWDISCGLLKRYSDTNFSEFDCILAEPFGVNQPFFVNIQNLVQPEVSKWLYSLSDTFAQSVPNEIFTETDLISLRVARCVDHDAQDLRALIDSSYCSPNNNVVRVRGYDWQFL